MFGSRRQLQSRRPPEGERTAVSGVAEVETRPLTRLEHTGPASDLFSGLFAGAVSSAGFVFPLPRRRPFLRTAPEDFVRRELPCEPSILRRRSSVGNRVS
jgi:hypothetical protein